MFLTICGGFCRLTPPPVPSPGGSDLFPGPGAGVFPSRFVSVPIIHIFHLLLQKVHIYLIDFEFFCRGPGVGGSMLIGMIV